MPLFKKLCISFSAMLVAVLLMAGAAYAESAKTGIITGDVVNLRANPNTSSKILNQLEKGTKVSVVGSEGDWYKVSYNDNTGWVNDAYITIRDQADSAGIITGSVVNVRSKPNTSSEILTKLNKGDKVEIYEKSGDWVRISIGEGRYGWVNGEYVSIRSESVSRGDDRDGSALAQESAGTDGNQDLRQSIVAYAKTLLGVKYVYGSSSPTAGFDCSGFVGYVFDHFGINLERSSRDMGSSGKEVAKSELQPGDLVFFDTNGGQNGINHVGIYIGNGSFIHASSGTARKVTINSLNDSFYIDKFMRARDYISK